MRKRVLILGHTGKVGTAIRSELGPNVDVQGVNSQDLDGRDLDSVAALIEGTAPDVVVNCIAYLGIENCEGNPALAFHINSLLPLKLRQLSESLGFLLIHFSTESVFSGVKGSFVGESDTPDPVNVYGISKHAGDLALSDSNALIFRLPVLFGESGSQRVQFLERMISLAAKSSAELRIADDVVTSPTYASDVAAVVVQALCDRLAPGLYHVTNSGSVSLCGLVRWALDALGLSAQVTAVSHTEFPRLGRQHLVTPLMQERLPPLRSWRAALTDYCESVSLTNAV